MIAADNRLLKVEELEPCGPQGESAALTALEKEGYRVCIIDTPAAFGVRFMSALLAGDFVIALIELEVYSMQGLTHLITTIANARRINPRLRFLGMLVNKIDRRNPRRAFDPDTLAELAATIAARGVMTPISVRKDPAGDGRYVSNQGHRRFRAAKIAGLRHIPAVINESFRNPKFSYAIVHIAGKE